jgi:hypothetical protein
LPPGTNGYYSASTVTNSAGASAEQLAGQLQDLRSVVEQTLPALSAYTQAASNSTTAGGRSIAGTVGQIISGVLNRNNANATGATPGPTNLVGVLEGLLSTNTPANGANATTLRDLATLQTDLDSVRAALDRLNVTGSTNGSGGLTPTGR